MCRKLHMESVKCPDISRPPLVQFGSFFNLWAYICHIRFNVWMFKISITLMSDLFHAAISKQTPTVDSIIPNSNAELFWF